MKALTLAFIFALTLQGFSQNIQEEVYDNGVLKRQVFIDGETSQVKTYYSNGQLKEVSSFVNETADGLWIRYNEKGQKISQGYFKDGEKHGNWIIWSTRGNELYRISYENNTKTAVVKLDE